MVEMVEMIEMIEMVATIEMIEMVEMIEMIGRPLLGVPRIPIERVVLNAGRPAVRTPCRYEVLR